MRSTRAKLAAIAASLALCGFASASPAADGRGSTATGTAAAKRDSDNSYQTNHQIEAGARQIGRGVEQAAKDISTGVKQGAQTVSTKVKEAANEAEPKARSAWQRFKDGAAETGRSVKSFLDRLFNA